MERTSKTMSWFLRHGGQGKLQSDGFIEISELSKEINIPVSVMKSLVEAQTEDERRFEMKGTLIRAMQGHSIKELDDDTMLTLITKETVAQFTSQDPKTKRRVVVHGTSTGRVGGTKLKTILNQTGLSVMARKHVHFLKSKSACAKYHSHYNLFIACDIEAAMDHGIKFYHNARGTVLSPGNSQGIVPFRFLRLMD